jgi:type IV secretion system protein TrbF
MKFKRTLQRYGQTPEPVTPYQKAAQLWDERIGSSRVQARNWRMMAFGCLTLSVGLAGGTVWQSMQSRVTPYVVEVDKLGEVRAVGPAIESYQPDDAQIAGISPASLPICARSPSIRCVVRQNWLEAYDFATDRAALFLNDYARASDPFTAVGTRSASVQVTSVVRASDSSFQVKWTEETYERGNLASTARWTAILTTVIQPPHSAEVLRKNPLGLYVNGIAWSRELDTATVPEERTPQ